MKQGCKLALILLGVYLSSTANAAETLLYLKSEEGDYIGGGQEVVYSTAELDFAAQVYSGNVISAQMNNFSRTNPSEIIWWYADFAAPFGEPLIIGRYEEATRFPFQTDDEAGLSIVGNGRGCNQLTGRFEVKEALYDVGTGEVMSFAVDFEQHCEGAPPALFGSIRINSDIPIPAILPARIVLQNPLNAESCVEALGPDGSEILLSAMIAQEDPSNPFAYDWSTSTGIVGQAMDFSFQLGLDQNTTALLVITDTQTGESASSALSVCVSDTTSPMVKILSPIDGQEFFGNNLKLKVSIADTVDKNISRYQLFVGENRSVQFDPKAQPSVVDLFKPDSSSGVAWRTITVTAEDSSGNQGNASVQVQVKHDSSK